MVLIKWEGGEFMNSNVNYPSKIEGLKTTPLDLDAEKTLINERENSIKSSFPSVTVSSTKSSLPTEAFVKHAKDSQVQDKALPIATTNVIIGALSNPISEVKSLFKKMSLS